MTEADDGGRAALRAFAVAALALAGFALSLTPLSSALDDRLLDREWQLLRRFAPKPAPDDIIVVGIDPASVESIPAPPGLWHEQLGLALARIASAKPRAIGFNYPLPERSYDAIHPGLDRALLVGVAAAVRNGPFVAALNIDARTRSARRIHTPFLAALGDSRLGIGLLARDDDGVTRRFSLAIPTEDGSFPTFAGRLCRALSKECGDGLIDYSLGPALRYVPLRKVLETPDLTLLERLFRERIVLVGEVQPYADRIAAPVNLAGWEGPGRDSPAIVVHAQSLRTALASAPQEASRPLAVLLLSIAALAFLIRDWRVAFVAAGFAAVVAIVGALAALRSGLYIALAPALATLALATLARAATAWRARRTSGTRNIRHSA
ncbi:MAG: CHASE2 domain-containing protein [Usitatibacter sp.]